MQLHFLLTGYEIKEYNIHVICKLLKFSVHQTRLLKVLVICLRAGFVRSKRCSLLELVSKKHYGGLPNCESLATREFQRLEKKNECKND